MEKEGDRSCSSFSCAQRGSPENLNRKTTTRLKYGFRFNSQPNSNIGSWVEANLEDVRNKQATELESVRKELEAAKTDLEKEREQSKKSLEALEKELEQQKAATEKAVAEAAAAAAGSGTGVIEQGGTETKTAVKEAVEVVEVPPVPSPSGASSTRSLAAAGSTGKATSEEETFKPTLSSGATPGSAGTAGVAVLSEESESAKVKEVEAEMVELNAAKEKKLLELQPIRGSFGAAAAAAPESSLAAPLPGAGPTAAGLPATAPPATGPPVHSSSPPALSQNHTETQKERFKAYSEQQVECRADEDAVLQLFGSDLGFDNDRPMTACLLYKALLHWKSFEAERATVFDRVIQILDGAVEGREGANGSANGTSNNTDRLAYRLTNAACLLHLLQRSLRPGMGLGSTTLQRRTSQTGSENPTLRTCMTEQVNANYPALLFKAQLTMCVEKLFGAIRDNIKKEITPSLQACIQAPRISTVTTRQGLPAAAATAAQASAGADRAVLLVPALDQNWTQIIKRLTELLNTLKANCVPPFLIRHLFTQVFSFINVQLFNSLLLIRECCSFSNGEYVKAGLAELEKWIREAKSEYTGNAWEELKHIRQAAAFLVIHQMPKKTFEDITADVCPALTMHQLYRMSTMYWDGKYGTQSVSADVISTMRARVTEAAAASGHSTNFLLDDDSGTPFTVDEISRNLPSISLKGLTAPSHLRSNSTFSYLFIDGET